VIAAGTLAPMMWLLYALADAVPKLTAPEKPVGGVSAQSVILDAIVFVLGVAILGGLLIWIGKRVFIDEKY
jgi:hypothetical protein